VGFVETERPSDWVLQRAGRAAGLDVDAIDYRVPAALQAAAVALFAACGCAVAAAFQALLGDATWSVSTGLGSCMAVSAYLGCFCAGCRCATPLSFGGRAAALAPLQQP
jgi:hypothetical protein